MDKAFKLIDMLRERPMTVFIILTCLFGYGYFEQSLKQEKLLLEVGGLRAQMATMQTIIELNKQIECKEAEHVRAD